MAVTRISTLQNLLRNVVEKLAGKAGILHSGNPLMAIKD